MSRIVIKGAAFVIAATLACGGCARRVTRSTRAEASDSLLTAHIRTEARAEASRTGYKDSTAHERADSVRIYDSIHVTEHADGSVEVFRFRDRYRGRALTETRKSSRERADSVSVSSRDTMAVKAKSTTSTESLKSARQSGGILCHILPFAALVISLACIYSIIRKKQFLG